MIADASAILASLHQERGAENVKKHVGSLIISAINYSEVLQSLIKIGASLDVAKQATRPLIDEVIDVTTSLAEQAAALLPTTQPLRLSIADRFCLALAIERDLPVLTADRVWAKLDIEGLEVQLIR